MRPKFNEAMQQLGLHNIDDKFFLNNDIILAGRYFHVLVQVDEKKCVLFIGEHPKDVYNVDTPILAKNFDFNDDAGLAIYFTLSTTFMEQHLFHEFQNYVKEQAA